MQHENVLRAINGDSIPKLLLDCLNVGDATPLLALCVPQLVVHSAILSSDIPQNSVSSDPLGRVIRAYRSKFPGIRFSLGIIETRRDDISFTWQGQFNALELQNRAVTVPGTGRIRLNQDEISEIWLAMDAYSLLAQFGKICADPGKSVGRSAEVNQFSAKSLLQAIGNRESVPSLLNENVLLRANIVMYKNIKERMSTEQFRIEGVRKLGDLFDLIHDRFKQPIELSFGDGISQGFTTTFRGKIRAKIGTELQRYNIVCGFVSPNDRLSECWIHIAPPPTLMECFV